jgi:hypothetical protein
VVHLGTEVDGSTLSPFFFAIATRLPLPVGRVAVSCCGIDLQCEQETATRPTGIADLTTIDRTPLRGYPELRCRIFDQHNCPGLVVACNPPSGSCFPIGVTTVVCTATDTAGNTATCSFTVTTFDVALQDDSDPSIILLWNSITGQYRFCCKGTTFSGVGKATIQGCVFTLQHNPVDRRVLGRVDKAVHAGNASIQSPAGTTRCTITDRNTLNDTLLPACQ